MAGWEKGLGEYGRLHGEIARLLALWREAPGEEDALEREIETQIGRLFIIRRELAAALRPLPSARREPLIRQYLYGQAPEEIAEDIATFKKWGMKP